MNKEFISYEQALALKVLGFDEPCFTYYELDGRLSDTPKETGEDIKYPGDCKFDKHQNQYLDEDEACSAPTFSQAFRFFREKYKIGTWIHHYFDVDKGNFQYSWIITLPYKDDGYVYETYEEAEFECLKKLIKIVKEK